LTLVELLVAMAVGTVLLAGVGTVFVATLTGVRTTNVKTSTGADVRLAIEAMTRTLKVADVPYGEDAAFVSASTSAMSFYALLNRSGAASTAEPIPTLIQYSWSASTKCLTEKQTAGTAIAAPATGGPYYDWTTAPTQTKCLLRTTTAPTFTYFNSSLITAAALSGASSGLNAADLVAVRSVELLLVATDPSNPQITGVPANTRVTLENVLVGDGS
jgi:Tfp pilus assembly protein PilW